MPTQMEGNPSTFNLSPSYSRVLAQTVPESQPREFPSGKRHRASYTYFGKLTLINRICVCIDITIRYGEDKIIDAARGEDIYWSWMATWMVSLPDNGGGTSSRGRAKEILLIVRI